MKNRLEILDVIGQLLTERLGSQNVTQRPDGILIVAGDNEAYAVQVLTIDAPDGVPPEEFGQDLVRHIEGSTSKSN